VAQRVAEEMGCELGGVVGYAIRFEEVASQVRLLRWFGVEVAVCSVLESCAPVSSCR